MIFRTDSLRLWLALAARNVLRQRGRTAMTLAAIACGAMGLIASGGFVADLLVQFREAIIHSQTGHIQFARKGFFSSGSRSPDQYVITEPGRIAAQLDADPRVADVMARITFAGLLNNGRTDLPVLGVGVEPAKEARLGTRLMLARGRALTDQDATGMMVGRELAHALRLDIGDQATLVATTAGGAMNTVELVVIGIFQTFSRDYDARAVRLPLAAAQELLGTRGANTLTVSLKRSEDTAMVADATREWASSEQLDLRTWNELSEFYEKTVDLYARQFGVLRIIILVMVLLGVANSVNISLLERIAEFGTMRAMGNRARDLHRLLLFEATILALIGATIGVIAGCALALGVSAIGIQMPPPPNSELGYVARISLALSEIIAAFLIVAVATLLAYVPATLRVARIPVVDALRHSH
ncbi:MAG: ABC transporter permease [Burkholderiales bacterium]